VISKEQEGEEPFASKKKGTEPEKGKAYLVQKPMCKRHRTQKKTWLGEHFDAQSYRFKK